MISYLVLLLMSVPAKYSLNVFFQKFMCYKFGSQGSDVDKLDHWEVTESWSPSEGIISPMDWEISVALFWKWVLSGSIIVFYLDASATL